MTGGFPHMIKQPCASKLKLTATTVARHFETHLSPLQKSPRSNAMHIQTAFQQPKRDPRQADLNPPKPIRNRSTPATSNPQSQASVTLNPAKTCPLQATSNLHRQSENCSPWVTKMPPTLAQHVRLQNRPDPPQSHSR
jgi:hypothetical protein